MQKRYCTCGHMIFVRYLSERGIWRSHFVTEGSRRAHSKTAHSCPGCGAPLSIHRLR